MLDNHNATNGQREYESRTDCPNCKRGDFYDINWCDNDNRECYGEDCNSFSHGYDCPMMSKRIKCNKCGYVGVEEI